MIATPAFAGLVYDNVPDPLPASLVSQSYQAWRYSEFGDLISLGGSPGLLNSVTVDMITWGYFSKYNTPDTPNTGGWTDPAITLNLYNVNTSGANPAPGSPIGSVTQSIFVPWRPEPAGSPLCPGTLWLASDGCHNGMAFAISFDFTSQAILLPDQLIFGIAYNTQSAGQSPTGVNGPYNDLNVGLNATPTIGSNPNAPLAYVNGTLGSSYADGGTRGINVFRLDTGSTHTDVAIEFDAAPEPGTLGMLLGGGLMVALGAIRRRKA